MPPTRKPKSAASSTALAVSNIDYEAAMKIAKRRKSQEKLIQDALNKEVVGLRKLTRLMGYDVQLAGAYGDRMGNPDYGTPVAKRHLATLQILRFGGHFVEIASDDDGWDEGAIAAAEEAMAAADVAGRDPAPVVRLLPDEHGSADDIVDEG